MKKLFNVFAVLAVLCVSLSSMVSCNKDATQPQDEKIVIQAYPGVDGVFDRVDTSAGVDYSAIIREDGACWIIPNGFESSLVRYLIPSYNPVFGADVTDPASVAFYEYCFADSGRLMYFNRKQEQQ